MCCSPHRQAKSTRLSDAGLGYGVWYAIFEDDGHASEATVKRLMLKCMIKHLLRDAL